MAAIDLIYFTRVLIFPGLAFILVIALFIDWVTRKVEARMQNRVGPTVAGPGGILQPLADILKLLFKERLVPRNVRTIAFNIAPLLSLSIFIFTMFYLPIDGMSVIAGMSFEGDLILVLAIITLANLFIFLAGWASTNAYSKIGASRVLTMFLGYDIPLFIVALTPAFLANSLSIATIAANQTIPYLFLIPWSFILFVVVMQVELEKDPFDIPDAETEIVGGYETEYGGPGLASLKLARDVQLFLGAALVVELFLGGPYGPVFFDLPMLWYTLWFILKVLFVVLIGEFIGNIFARLRIDQVLTASWKQIIPLSIVTLMATLIAAAWVVPFLGVGG